MEVRHRFVAASEAILTYLKAVEFSERHLGCCAINQSAKIKVLVDKTVIYRFLVIY